MKLLPRCSVLFGVLALFAAGSARAQFPNFPAADRVLGATDFDTVGNTSVAKTVRVTRK